jgi:hypothetical protein
VLGQSRKLRKNLGNYQGELRAIAHHQNHQPLSLSVYSNFVMIDEEPSVSLGSEALLTERNLAFISTL